VAPEIFGHLLGARNICLADRVLRTVHGSAHRRCMAGTRSCRRVTVQNRVCNLRQKIRPETAGCPGQAFSNKIAPMDK